MVLRSFNLVKITEPNIMLEPLSFESSGLIFKSASIFSAQAWALEKAEKTRLFYWDILWILIPNWLWGCKVCHPTARTVCSKIQFEIYCENWMPWSGPRQDNTISLCIPAVWTAGVTIEKFATSTGSIMWCWLYFPKYKTSSIVFLLVYTYFTTFITPSSRSAKLTYEPIFTAGFTNISIIICEPSPSLKFW